MYERVVGKNPILDLADQSTSIFLYQEEQVDFLRQHAPDLLRECQLTALTLDVNTKLRKLGYHSEAAWRYFNLDELSRINAEAESLMRKWFSLWEKYYQCAGISIPLVDHETQKWFFRDAIFIREFTKKVFGTPRGIKRIVLPSSLSKPCLYYLKSDTPSAVLAYLAELSGIEVIQLRALVEKESVLSGIRHKLAGFKGLITQSPASRQNVRYYHRGYASQKLSKITSKLKSTIESSRPSIGVSIHGMAFHEELVELLSQAGFDVVVFLLFEIKRELEMKLSKHAKLIRLYEVNKQPSEGKSSCNIQDAWQEFQNQQSSGHVQYAEVFANRYLDFHFKHYFSERWMSTAGFIESTEKRLAELDLGCLITTNLTDTENWVLFELAKKRGIPTLISLHSGWTNPRPLFYRASKVMLWSRTQMQSLPGNSSSNVVITGALGYDTSRNVDKSTLTVDREEILGSLGIPTERKVILVLPTNANTGLFPVLDIEKHLQTFQELHNLPDDLKGKVHIIIKTKRDFDHKQTYELIRENKCAQEHVTVVSDISLEEMVAVCDIAMIVNIPTTAYLEPIFQGKPLLFINAVNIEYCGQPQIAEANAYRIYNISGIWPTLRRLLSEPMFCKEVVDKQWSFQESDMPIGKVKQRILEELESIYLSSKR